MTVYDIIKEWLKENGYDGLCAPDFECGCSLDDFMPCGQPSPTCEAGHKGKAPEWADTKYFIYPGKKKEE